MTNYRSDPFAGIPFDQPIRMPAVAWGMTYPGEVVRIDQWVSRWGRDLDPSLCFRVVIIAEGAALPSSTDLADDRIVALRPRGYAPVLREATATYPAASQTDDSPPPEEDDLVAASGRPLPIDPRLRNPLNPDAFRAFLDALVRALYDIPPVDLTGTPERLDAPQARLLWEGLASRTPRAAARGALRYAPALGLDAGSAGIPSIVDTIVDAARSPARDEGVLLSDLRLRLLREAGLPPYLTALYILVIVLRGESLLELTLMPNARLSLLEGRIYAEERVGSHLLSGLVWTEDVESAMVSLAPSEAPSWRRVRPYLQLFLEDTVPSEETELVGAMRSRAAAVKDIQSEIHSLVETLALPTSKPFESLVILDQVDSVLAATTPGALVSIVQSSFASIVEVAETVAELTRAEALAQVGPVIRDAWSYLENSIIDDGELKVDQKLIRSRMGLEALWASPGSWPGVEEQFIAFRARYARRYVEAHEGRNKELAILHRLLEEGVSQVTALQRLNAIRTLGGPLEPDIPSEHEGLLRETAPCEEEDLATALQRAPRCPSCSMTLDAVGAPTEQVDQLLRRLDRVLAEQRRRLGSQTVRQVLARGNLDQLDRFLQAVQASDVESLTNLLDDPLVAFIERLLQRSSIRSPRRSILERLQERFPSVGPEEVNVVAAELARLLRQELEADQVMDQPGSNRIALW